MTKAKRIQKAIERVERHISGFAERGHVAAGLSSEGYNGGYRDALADVLLLLGGTAPQRHDFWITE